MSAGPLPHSRWLVGYEREAAGWSFNTTAADGSTLRPIGSTVIDDDHLGHVAQAAAGAEFCLDAQRSGNIEVWHAPLVDGKHAVAVVNRSPAGNQNLTVAWETLGIAPSQAYSVRDVWRSVDAADGEGSPRAVGSFAVAGLDPRASAFLILTPA